MFRSWVASWVTSITSEPGVAVDADVAVAIVELLEVAA